MNINLITPINQLGYGIVGLNVLKALSKSNKVSLWFLGNPEAHPNDHEIIKQAIANQNTFDHHAPCLRIWHQHDMAMHVGKGLHVGMPIFELDRFTPLEVHHLSSLDKVFVCSRWAKQILMNHGISPTAIKVTSLGVDAEIFKPNLADTGKTTRFLNVGKWEIRKGHDILLEAFNKAFEPSDDVELVMNCFNPFLVKKDSDDNQKWNKMYKTSKMGDKITIIEDRLPTQYDLADLMNSVDCGVFPARAEGWNLDLLEMMACGKDTIATFYSGHTQFVSADDCYTITVNKTEPAHDGIWFYGQGNWASFDESTVEQLVTHMRNVHSKKQKVGQYFNAEALGASQAFTWNDTATEIIEGFK